MYFRFFVRISAKKKEKSPPATLPNPGETGWGKRAEIAYFHCIHFGMMDAPARSVWLRAVDMGRFAVCQRKPTFPLRI
jgi:hypothetical protein